MGPGAGRFRPLSTSRNGEQMKLTKEQALDLVKVLSHYGTFTDVVNVNVSGLCSELEDYVLSDGEEVEEETDDEEDEEDTAAAEGPSGEEDEEEPREQEDDEGSEAASAGEEADEQGDEELYPDCAVHASTLHDLKAVKAKVISSSVGDPDDEVRLEFEECDSECDLLVDGDPTCRVQYVRRSGTELHVAELTEQGLRNWHVFGVLKFPKEWTAALPVGELVEVY